MYLKEPYRTTDRSSACKAKSAYPLELRVISGQRYLHPELGRWTRRDPSLVMKALAEDTTWHPAAAAMLQSSSDLQHTMSYDSNQPANKIDPIGLASVSFEVVTGHMLGLVRWAGEWGQPAGTASGTYTIGASYAFSTVRVDNDMRPVLGISPPASACNTVMYGWNPSHSAEIRVTLSSCWPGRYNVVLMANVSLSKGGPFGAATFALYERPLTPRWSKTLTRRSVWTDRQNFSFIVTLSSLMEAWGGKEFARYTPTLVEPNDPSVRTGGTVSWGRASARIDVISITRL